METGVNVRWRRVLRQEPGTFRAARATAISMACNHCENAFCPKVRPVRAIWRRDGIVLIGRKKRAGSRRRDACPCAAPQFNPVTGKRTKHTKCFCADLEQAQSVPHLPGSTSTSCGTGAAVRCGVIRFLQRRPGTRIMKAGFAPKGQLQPGSRTPPAVSNSRRSAPARERAAGRTPDGCAPIWTEALDTAAARFSEIREKYGPEALLAIFRGSPAWFARLHSLLGMERGGHNGLCHGADSVVQQRAIATCSFARDLEDAKCIVLFGSDFMARVKLCLAGRLLYAGENGARVVSFNPLCTTTARFCDEWHPVRPGGGLTIALAMIHVLFKENLHDKQIAEKHTKLP